MIRRTQDQAGYSLVEVMASIMLLSIAIIPMVGMFDMGLNAATRGSNYDKARALASQQLEIAKSRPYESVRNNFPNGVAAPGASGSITSSPQTSGAPAGFQYVVRKRYVVSTPNGDIQPPSPPASYTRMMEVTVTVSWGDSNDYSSTSLVSKAGSP